MYNARSGITQSTLINGIDWIFRKLNEQKSSSMRKTLPRGIEPRSPALLGVNDKRKSSPLDQGRLNDRVTARPLGWLMKGSTCQWIQCHHNLSKHIHALCRISYFAYFLKIKRRIEFMYKSSGLGIYMYQLLLPCVD
ncbi:hypothetical protein N7508_008941 [Penicillium antarcticum]|uniref:uncharacterized protein n=1 Tax=Penicillium antarcticum TaxID=416450 RepID=UPI0023A693E9|nr:uncharacterized protein N7508_008941 [Penicillium antarcticum]KAJ5294120.1 hypothetical protein N7508_008941 [Penicillium antarcticum]